jgi:hypothetical protein
MPPVRFEFRADSVSERSASQLACVRTIIDNRAYQIPAEGFSEANHRLWDIWDNGSTRLVYTDDRLVADVLIRHLDTDGNVVARVLFDEMARRRIDREFDLLADTTGYSVLRNTYYFWSILGGRIRPMHLRNGRLCEITQSESRSVLFKVKDVRQALAERHIIPDLRLGFFVLTILPHVRALGGAHQLMYLPLIHKAWTTVLASLGPAEAAQSRAIARVQDGWIAGLIGSHTDSADILEHAMASPVCFEADRWSNISVGESVRQLQITSYMARLRGY